MQHIKAKYDHYVADGVFFDKNAITQNYQFHIVYFVNCIINPNYFDWVKNQLSIVKDYENSFFYIVAIIEKEKEEEFKNRVILELDGFNNCCFNFYPENEHEYRGILHVWRLAQVHSDKNDVFLYFHSKGITHNDSYSKNINDNYNIILQDQNKIKEIFDLFPQIDKIGYLSGGIGWIWFNFWFARGSYLSKVERPIKTERRHYYEDWLGRQLKKGGDLFPEIEKSLDNYVHNLYNCYAFETDKFNYGNIGWCFDSAKNQLYKI